MNEDVPELTWKAIGLGILLSVVLSGANAYLGLYAGMTVSASIPAAVLSMVILRMFRKSNILENNLVQTAASAGEAVAAGAIFTLPALMIMGVWSTFGYWEITLLVGIGGIIGVLFSIPLRRALILETDLRFPEGLATAEVLKTGHGDEQDKVENQSRNFLDLVIGALLGGLSKFLSSGVNLWSGTFTSGIRGFGTLWSFGFSLSPALLSVGYIVGFQIAVLIFAGGAMAWFIGIPLYGILYGLPTGSPFGSAMTIWSSQIRYVGVGAMVVGGLWSLIGVYEPLKEAFNVGFGNDGNIKNQSQESTPRLEQDIPLSYVIGILTFTLIPVAYLLWNHFSLTVPSLVMLVTVVIAGFLFSAIAGYMAGLVGSSNNPVSGVTIATILFASLLLLFLLGRGHPAGASGAIICGALVACASAISGDTMQDLKAGHIVKATPWKQQIMEFVGVISASFIIFPVLYLLQTRYGIGPPTPAHPDSLSAPQATLMASVAEGVFGAGLPWRMIVTGMVVAIGIILLDLYLKWIDSDWRVPVLAVAVGIYLPLQLSTTICLGGLVALAVGRTGKNADSSDPGMLVASGMITGEAMIGIFLALPIIVAGISPLLGPDMFKFFETVPLAGRLIGWIYFFALLYFIYNRGTLINGGN